MASRYPTTHVLDYCFRPIHIVDDNKDLFVPCGKCDGCLLHRANEWSMRVGMECEATPFSIFSTLTYDNKYLPKLMVIKRVDDNTSRDYKAKSYYVLISDNDLNIRFNGVKDVRRKEEFDSMYFTCFVDDFKTIRNFPYKEFTCYSSKRDFQLYLKLLRKDLENVGIIRKNESKCFRYFAVSEYGPTTFRSHIHFILFPKNEKVATYLIEYGLYKNWQMCHKDRIEGYTHFCDSGARGYLTQYLTQFSSLPSLYKDNKELKPFRLSSKSPAIGYIEQQNAKIYEDVSVGITEYCRKISRLGTKVVVNYPKDYCASLFVKCEGYSKLSFSRLVWIYGCLWRLVRFGRYDSAEASLLLSKASKPMNYIAARKCFDFCVKYETSPEYYVYLVDSYYYKRAMSALKMQYEQLEFHCKSFRENFDFNRIITFLRTYYVNCSSFLKKNGTSLVTGYFLEGFRLSDYDVSEVTRAIDCTSYVPDETYVREVEDIVENMVKMAKFNEITGVAPTVL